jgi:hypothetical protein
VGTDLLTCISLQDALSLSAYLPIGRLPASPPPPGYIDSVPVLSLAYTLTSAEDYPEVSFVRMPISPDDSLRLLYASKHPTTLSLSAYLPIGRPLSPLPLPGHIDSVPAPSLAHTLTNLAEDDPEVSAS